MSKPKLVEFQDGTEAAVFSLRKTKQEKSLAYKIGIVISWFLMMLIIGFVAVSLTLIFAVIVFWLVGILMAM